MRHERLGSYAPDSGDSVRLCQRRPDKVAVSDYGSHSFSEWADGTTNSFCVVSEPGGPTNLTVTAVYGSSEKTCGASAHPPISCATQRAYI